MGLVDEPFPSNHSMIPQNPGAPRAIGALLEPSQVWKALSDFPLALDSVSGASPPRAGLFTAPLASNTTQDRATGGLWGCSELCHRPDVSVELWEHRVDHEVHTRSFPSQNLGWGAGDVGGWELGSGASGADPPLRVLHP